MLTPEGKKVPTRGRGMSAKKTPGQAEEKVKEEEVEVVEVHRKAEEKAEAKAGEKAEEKAKQWGV